jgi:hypothetical protein
MNGSMLMKCSEHTTKFWMRMAFHTVFTIWVIKYTVISYASIADIKQWIEELCINKIAIGFTYRSRFYVCLYSTVSGYITTSYELKNIRMNITISMWKAAITNNYLKINQYRLQTRLLVPYSFKPEDSLYTQFTKRGLPCSRSFKQIGLTTEFNMEGSHYICHANFILCISVRYTPASQPRSTKLVENGLLCEMII